MLAPATRRAWGAGLDRFARFLTQRQRLAVHRIRPRDVEEFQGWLGEQRVQKGGRAGLPLASATVQLWMESVFGFCQWLVDIEVLLLNPCQLVPRVRVHRGLPHVLTVAEVERLLIGTRTSGAVELRNRAIVELLYTAGLRVGELHRLDLTDLDLVGAEVFIRSSKNGRSRHVPMGEPAILALTRYLREAREVWLDELPPGIFPAVFLSQWGHRLSATMIEKIVRDRASAAGLPGRVTPHTLRHSAAVHLLKRGADIRFIQAFLGHETVETTVHYTRLQIDDLKETLAQCHPRERSRKENSR